MNLALFDFDGTLTTRDTLWEFISFCNPRWKLWAGYLMATPWLSLLAMRLISPEAAKKKVLTIFFRGWTRTQFEIAGNKFCNERLPALLNETVFADFKVQCESGNKVCIVTASCEPWVLPFCRKHKCDLICTRLQYTKDIFYGEFGTPNCNREEKAIRIHAEYKLADYSFIIAYGNRGSDDAMLNLAHERRVI